VTDAPPPGTETFLMQASEQLQDGHLEEAVETFSAALAMSPQDARALRGRGLAYLQLKRWAEAAANFEAARDAAPEDPENWVDLAISLAMNNRIYPAIDVFEALLARQPDCLRGHLEFGLLQLRLGAVSKGREELQRALACRPTLAQRRMVESVLREQDKLDRKRYYRPDFDALRRQQSLASWGQRLRAFFTHSGGEKPKQ